MQTNNSRSRYWVGAECERQRLGGGTGVGGILKGFGRGDRGAVCETLSGREGHNVAR
jgi:hypothetical protein